MASVRITRSGLGVAVICLVSIALLSGDRRTAESQEKGSDQKTAVTTTVCAVLPVMSHDDGMGGTYCTYYAIDCATFMPYGMDGPCGLNIGDCNNPQEPECVSVALKPTRNPKGHLATPNFQGLKKLLKSTSKSKTPAQSHAKAKIETILERIIKFRLPGETSDRYAKVYALSVSFKERDPNSPNPDTILAPGWEIEPVSGDVLDAGAAELHSTQPKLAIVEMGALTFTVNIQ